MAVTNISQNWQASYWKVAADSSLDDINFNAQADKSATVEGGLSVTTPPDTGSEDTTHASKFTSSFTTDEAGETTFHLTVCGAAEVYIDGVKVIDLTSSVLPGAGSDGCLNTGANICHCESTENKVSGAVKLDLSAGEHTVEVVYLDHPLSDGLYFGWDANGSSGQEFDLTIPQENDEDPSEIGQWGDVFNTTIMGIHQVMLEDGRVLYWGDNGKGSAFSNSVQYAIFDPATGKHEVLDATFAVKSFCGAGILIPGTDKILIGGGNGSGVNDGKIFDLSDQTLENAAEYTMAADRFYPTTVSLSTGQVVILGGNGDGKETPEIFTLGQGWHRLEGATDTDIGANWWYPKAWVNNKGEVVYIAINKSGQNGGTNAAGTFEVMALDPSGDGSIREIGEAPFQMDVRSTAVMYDVGKVVVMDHTGDLWYMDINGDEAQFSFALDLPKDRENGDMTVMADGRILLSGGTTNGNSQDYANAQLQSVIFDPFSGQVDFVDSESVLRAYHSSTILLADGTIMSSGGGGLGDTKHFQDAQIFKPDYLFNEDGTLADRPEISAAPDEVVPGETFVITVDDAASIARMSFVKTGAVTHSVNMESGRMDLEFKVLSPTQIEVSLPENPHVLGAGNWMLFAIDTVGVPSVAPIISVQPTLDPYNYQEGGLTAEYFVLDAPVNGLAHVDFNQQADKIESVSMINFNTAHGSGYIGGPTDNFAAKYTGPVTIEQGGNYTFYLKSDDGAQLFIDGKLVVNNDGVHATVEKTASVNLSKGDHDIEVRYFENGGEAVLDLDWAGPGFGREQMIFEQDANTSPVDPKQGGLMAEYFALDAPIPSLAHVDFDAQPVSTQSIDEINFYAGDGSFYAGGRTNNFAAKYTGKFTVDQGGNYTFYLKSDDGGQLFIDGKLVVNNDGVHAAVEKTATVNLSKGDHDIEVRYFENGGQATLDLDWAGPGFGREQMTFEQDASTPPLDPTDPTDPTNPDYVLDVAGSNEVLTGTGSEVFVINGNSADYGWGPTEDDTGAVIWNGTNFDLLFNFAKVKFNDLEVDLSNFSTTPFDPSTPTDPVDPNEVIDDASENQFLNGNGGEVFVVNAPSTSYGWDQTEDGKGVVIWNDTQFDVLEGFKAVRFTDGELNTADLSLSPLGPVDPSSVNKIDDIAGETQFVTGTTGKDAFVINGNSSDYGYNETEDNTGYVVYGDTGFDLLFDVEQIEFTDQTIDLDPLV